MRVISKEKCTELRNSAEISSEKEAERDFEIKYLEEKGKDTSGFNKSEYEDWKREHTLEYMKRKRQLFNEHYSDLTKLWCIRYLGSKGKDVDYIMDRLFLRAIERLNKLFPHSIKKK